MTPNQWTDAATVELRKLWAAGRSASDCAAAMAKNFGIIVTRNAVLGKLHRIGVPKRLRPQAVVPPARTARIVINGKKYKDVPLWSAARPRRLSAPDIPLEQRKKFIELRSHHCRFPYGDPGNSDFFFCGADVIFGQSYCVNHYPVVYQESRLMQRRHAGWRV